MLSYAGHLVLMLYYGEGGYHGGPAPALHHGGRGGSVVPVLRSVGHLVQRGCCAGHLAPRRCRVEGSCYVHPALRCVGGGGSPLPVYCQASWSGDWLAVLRVHHTHVCVGCESGVIQNRQQQAVAGRQAVAGSRRSAGRPVGRQACGRFGRQAGRGGEPGVRRCGVTQE